jgi:hypothetical protein
VRGRRGRKAPFAHCLFTVHALFIDCVQQRFTVRSRFIRLYVLPMHCLFNVYSPYIQCSFTVQSLSNHCLFTAYSLSIHCLCTVAFTVSFTVSFTVRRLSTHVLLSRKDCLFPSIPLCTLFIHCLFTVYLLSIHCLFTVYSLSIHCLFCEKEDGQIEKEEGDDGEKGMRRKEEGMTG